MTGTLPSKEYGKLYHVKLRGCPHAPVHGHSAIPTARRCAGLAAAHPCIRASAQRSAEPACPVSLPGYAARANGAASIFLPSLCGLAHGGAKKHDLQELQVVRRREATPSKEIKCVLNIKYVNLTKFVCVKW